MEANFHDHPLDGNVIFVRFSEGNRFVTIDYEYRCTVEKLKSILSEIVKISREELRIIFAGKQLEDWRLLVDYSVQKGSTMHLICKNKQGSIEDMVLTTLPRYPPLVRKRYHEYLVENLTKNFESLERYFSAVSNSLPEKTIPKSNNMMIRSLIDSSVNGPLTIVFSFLDFIDHLTTIPLCCRTFNKTSKFCLEQGIVAPRFSHFQLLFGDGVRLEPEEKSLPFPSESLTQRILQNSSKIRENCVHEVSQFLLSKKYFKASAYYFSEICSSDEKLLIHHYTIQHFFNRFLLENSLEVTKVFLEKYKELTIRKNATRRIVKEMNLMTYEELFSLSKINNHRFKGLDYHCREHFSDVTDPSIFRLLFNQNFPKDEYDQYVPVEKCNFEIGGFKYRMEGMIDLLRKSFYDEGWKSFPPRGLTTSTEVENFKFICRKEVDIVPTLDQKKNIDKNYPRSFFRKKHYRDRNELLEEHKASGRTVYSEESESGYKKRATMELLKIFWFPVDNLEILKMLLDYFCDCEDQYWLLVSPTRFRIERCILFSDDPSYVEELKKICDGYVVEEDPNREMVFHPVTIDRIRRKRRDLLNIVIPDLMLKWVGGEEVVNEWRKTEEEEHKQKEGMEEEEEEKKREI